MGGLWHGGAADECRGECGGPAPAGVKPEAEPAAAADQAGSDVQRVRRARRAQVTVDNAHAETNAGNRYMFDKDGRPQGRWH